MCIESDRRPVNLTVSARVEEDGAYLSETLAEEEGCDRSSFIKMLLRRGKARI